MNSVILKDWERPFIGGLNVPIILYTVVDFGTAMINWKASHKKLKGYKKQLKK